MGVDLRGALRAENRATPSRTLLWSIGLAVLLVAGAGMAGTTRLTGPRWFLNLGSVTPGKPPPRPVGRNGPRLHLGGGLPGWLGWVFVALAVAAALALLWRWWLARPSRPSFERRPVEGTLTEEVQATPEPEPEAPAVRSGIELALQALSEDREPADAVVRAWLGLQQTAEDSGIVRGPSETPTEFTSRILARVVTDDAALRTLLRLYLRTRFGDHPVTAEDVAAVRGALEELVRTWAAPGTPTPAGAR